MTESIIKTTTILKLKSLNSSLLMLLITFISLYNHIVSYDKLIKMVIYKQGYTLHQIQTHNLTWLHSGF